MPRPATNALLQPSHAPFIRSVNVRLFSISLVFAVLTLCALTAHAADNNGPFGIATPEWLSVHGQFTNVTQTYPSFTAPFDGPNSLPGHSQTKETVDATLYLGVKVMNGLELFVNPEIDQGFGLSNTFGVAGFPSGEAYKVGAHNPYFRLHRAFFRYTIGLGGEPAAVESAANQFPGQRPTDNVVITVGKFSAVDLFDTNTYAHDPRADFLNWSMIESGAYDYAADSWGYSYGAAIEWTQSWWTLRAGAFDMSTLPNGPVLETGFQQFELVAEAEERHELFGQPGKVKALVFANRARMGSYRDAVRLGQQTGAPPSTALVRRYRTRPGTALNIEQGLSADIGAFLRLSDNDGSREAFDFTDIDRSVAFGLSVKGNAWHRANDAIGLAGAVNGISRVARAYFAAGGLGTLIGDGQLPRYKTEKIIEAYYKAAVIEGISLSLDYQHVANPAYDAARGPVNILGVRLHGEF
jgi:high affinity Mn2+ porin